MVAARARTWSLGWPAEERPDGSVGIGLAASELYLPARLERCDAGIVLSAELTEVAGPRACRDALAALLLAMTAAHHWHGTGMDSFSKCCTPDRVCPTSVMTVHVYSRLSATAPVC